MKAILAIGVVAVLLTGCADKPKPAVAAASCPSPDQWKIADVIFPTLNAAFGKERLGYHTQQTSLSADPHGDILVHLEQIGPARLEQPGPGQGEKLVLVLKPCTGELIRFYKP